MALHPKLYRYAGTLERFNSDVKPHLPSKVTTNDNDINETKTCNYGDAFEVSLLLGSSHAFARDAVYSETLETDDAQNGHGSFEV